jgi:hypothetical protein
MKGWLLVVLFIVFPGITKSQTPYTLDVDYTRIATNNNDVPISDTLRVLFVIDDKCIGIVTKYDTLALIYLTRSGNFLMFVDCYHNDGQEYSIERHVLKGRFLWLVSPLRPYSKRKVYSLILESL